MTREEQKAYDKAYNKAYYEKNKEKVKSRYKIYRANNLEKVKERAKAYYATSRGAALVYLRCCEHSGHPCTNTLEEVIEYFENKPECCEMPGCGKKKKLVLDHGHIKNGKDGRIRGWICNQCNADNGRFESKEWQKNHADWVSRGQLAPFMSILKKVG